MVRRSFDRGGISGSSNIDSGSAFCGFGGQGTQAAYVVGSYPPRNYIVGDYGAGYVWSQTNVRHRFGEIESAFGLSINGLVDLCVEYFGWICNQKFGNHRLDRLFENVEKPQTHAKRKPKSTKSMIHMLRAAPLCYINRWPIIHINFFPLSTLLPINSTYRCHSHVGLPPQNAPPQTATDVSVDGIPVPR